MGLEDLGGGSERHAGALVVSPTRGEDGVDPPVDAPRWWEGHRGGVPPRPQVVPGRGVTTTSKNHPPRPRGTRVSGRGRGCPSGGPLCPPYTVRDVGGGRAGLLVALPTLLPFRWCLLGGTTLSSCFGPGTRWRAGAPSWWPGDGEIPTGKVPGLPRDLVKVLGGHGGQIKVATNPNSAKKAAVTFSLLHLDLSWPIWPGNPV